MENIEQVNINEDASLDLDKPIRRSAIHYNVGDTASLLGTTSDTVHMLLIAHLKLVNAIEQAESLSDIVPAAQFSSDLFSGILDKFDSNTLKFPYEQKSAEVVLNDIEQRANGVFEILSK